MMMIFFLCLTVSTDKSTDSSTTFDVSESSSDGSTEISDTSTESSTLENTELAGSSTGKYIEKKNIPSTKL